MKRSIALLCFVIAGCGGASSFALRRNHLGFALPRTPVMLLYVDGLNDDVLQDLARRGELPLIKRYLLDRAVCVDNAITAVPSVTYGNATTMVTGQNPGHHGIFANHWFDQHLLASRSYESVWTMGDVNHDFTSPTIYELLDGHVTAVIGMQVNRGAHIPLVTQAGNGGLPAGIAWQLGERGQVDGLMAGNLGQLATDSRRLGTWPDFTLVYFPAVDAIGHSEGSSSEAYRRTLRELDESLGGALRTLHDAGLLERMTIVLTSDHGHHPVTPANALDLKRFLSTDLGIPTYLTNDEGDRASDSDYADRALFFRTFRIVASHSGERYASLHLQSPRGWTSHPTLDETLAFHRGGAHPLEPALEALTFPEVLVRQPAIAFAAVRVAESQVRLWGKTGVSVIDRRERDGVAMYSYRVESGDDPLGYAADADARALADGELHTAREWLAATASLAHPYVVPQLCEAFESPRAGDVMIFASRGVDFGGNYRGGHGGLERDEMRIPLYFAGPGLPAGGRIRDARLTDVVPTILELMGWRDSVLHPHHFDGASIADQLRTATQRH